MNRILSIASIEEARLELEKIKVSSEGVALMAPKALGVSIKLTNVKLGAANILKQEMLSIGGDAAVARGVVNGAAPFSDVILLGDVDKIRKLIRKLGKQTIFGLPAIKKDLEVMLTQLLNRKQKTINCNNKILNLDVTRIMGILNVTPDSFSDGQKYIEPEKAVQHALQMIDDGADIIDIGGESTRPGSAKVDAAAEMERVIPVIKALREVSDIPISIDTTKAEVAEAAIKAGASIVNDISALRFDEKMIRVLQKYEQVPVILMHMQGTPETMQQNPYYEDTVDEILEFFKERIDFCLANGIVRERIIIDPGIGFGKRHYDNLLILKKLSELHCMNVPVLLAASRKSFIGRIYDSKAEDRLEGSLATTMLAFMNGIEMVRVHDVKEHHRLLQTLQAIEEIK